MTVKDFDPTNTSVEEIHEIICEDAVRIANDLVDRNARVAKKWKGPVFRNGSPYNDGRLVLEITEEYQSAPENVKRQYRLEGAQAVRVAIKKNEEIFVGMIFGEARAGRNYFLHWRQAPDRLFD